MNKRCRRERKPTNGSWRVDETYVRVKGKWVYLYRAVDSTGTTIDFLLSAHRDAAAAKRFFQRALRAPGHPRPRVIKVDGNPSCPKVVAELKDRRKTGPAMSVFPAGTGKWLIPTNGGSEPHWRRDGRELYYLAPDGKLMAVEVKTGSAFQAGVPRALFDARGRQNFQCGR